jgi:hypothetical protein
MTRKEAEETLAALPQQERETVESLRDAYRKLRQIAGSAGTIGRRQWARFAKKRIADVCLYADLVESLEGPSNQSTEEHATAANELPASLTTAIASLSETCAREFKAVGERQHKLFQGIEQRLQEQLAQAKADAAELSSLAEELAREVVKIEPLEEALKSATTERDVTRAALHDSISVVDLTRANLSEARSNFEILNNTYHLVEQELSQLLKERNFMQSAAERGSGLEVENAGLREKCVALGQEVGRLFQILSRQI